MGVSRVEELESFSGFSVGGELRMVELKIKESINEIKEYTCPLGLLEGIVSLFAINKKLKWCEKWALMLFCHC
jgi:hypothetical protein